MRQPQMKSDTSEYVWSAQWKIHIEMTGPGDTNYKKSTIAIN